VPVMRYEEDIYCAPNPKPVGRVGMRRRATTTTGFLIKSCVSADRDRFVGCHHVLEETEEIENFTCCENLGLRPKVSGQKGYLHESIVFL